MLPDLTVNKELVLPLQPMARQETYVQQPITAQQAPTTLYLVLKAHTDFLQSQELSTILYVHPVLQSTIALISEAQN